MNNKRAIFERVDGGISVIIPAPKNRLGVFKVGEAFHTISLDRGTGKFIEFAETEDEWLQRTVKEGVPKLSKLKGAKRLDDCLTTDLPNRRFRNCWRNKEGLTKVDMVLARVQRMSEVRVERDERFKAFDNEWMKFKGQGNEAEASKVEAKRETLRNIPNNLKLDAIKTPEELEKFEPKWPS